MNNYADLPWGFSLIVAPIKRRTTQRQSPTLRGSFDSLYKSDNSPVSCADRFLCTREPSGDETLFPFSDRIQRLRQVGDQVGCILDAAGVAHQTSGDPRFL